MDINTQNLVENKLLCPHCWFSFYRDEAFFISKHPSLFGDTVLGPAVNRRFTPQETKFNRQNEAHDSQGWKMEERACPQCHLQVPADLLFKRPYILSIVGVPRSGKTYFLTSMIHHLRKELVNSFGLSLQDTDKELGQLWGLMDSMRINYDHDDNRWMLQLGAAKCKELNPRGSQLLNISLTGKAMQQAELLFSGFIK